LFLRDLECTGCGISLVFRVGIGEKEPGALCLLHADPKGMVFPNPTIGQSGGFEQAQARNFLQKPSNYPGSPVRGLIVHHQDFGNFRLAR
jgi:hypothetical protein